MSTSSVSEPDLFRENQSTQVGLYIGLREGAEINLRIAARAALSFDEFLRAFVEEIEPNTPIEVTLIKGDIGSLNLVSSLKAKVSKKTLSAIAIVASGWIAGELASYTFGSVLDYLTKNLTDEQKSELSQNDLERIATACMRAGGNPQIIEKKDEISETLATDQNVTGLGITLGSERKPRHILPRNKFTGSMLPVHSSISTKPGSQTRVVRTVTDLILTEPVLIDKPRKWRFLFGKYEISASISDEIFKQKALQGKLDVQLSQGIVVTASLAITEDELEPNLWKPVKYEIEKVHKWKAEPFQMPLIPPDTEQ